MRLSGVKGFHAADHIHLRFHNGFNTKIWEKHLLDAVRSARFASPSTDEMVSTKNRTPDEASQDQCVSATKMSTKATGKAVENLKAPPLPPRERTLPGKLRTSGKFNKLLGESSPLASLKAKSQSDIDARLEKRAMSLPLYPAEKREREMRWKDSTFGGGAASAGRCWNYLSVTELEESSPYGEYVQTSGDVLQYTILLRGCGWPTINAGSLGEPPKSSFLGVQIGSGAASESAKKKYRCFVTVSLSRNNVASGVDADGDNDASAWERVGRTNDALLRSDASKTNALSEPTSPGRPLFPIALLLEIRADDLARKRRRIRFEIFSKDGGTTFLMTRFHMPADAVLCRAPNKEFSIKPSHWPGELLVTIAEPRVKRLRMLPLLRPMRQLYRFEQNIDRRPSAATTMLAEEECAETSFSFLVPSVFLRLRGAEMREKLHAKQEQLEHERAAKTRSAATKDQRQDGDKSDDDDGDDNVEADSSSSDVDDGDHSVWGLMAKKVNDDYVETAGLYMRRFLCNDAFRSSKQKKDHTVRAVPVNLHVQHFSVCGARPLKSPIPRHIDTPVSPSKSMAGLSTDDLLKISKRDSFKRRIAADGVPSNVATKLEKTRLRTELSPVTRTYSFVTWGSPASHTDKFKKGHGTWNLRSTIHKTDCQHRALLRKIAVLDMQIAESVTKRRQMAPHLKALREAFDEARASEEKYSKVIDDLFRDREHVDVVASSDTATDLRKLLDVAIRSDGEVKDENISREREASARAAGESIRRLSLTMLETPTSLAVPDIGTPVAAANLVPFSPTSVTKSTCDADDEDCSNSDTSATPPPPPTPKIEDASSTESEKGTPGGRLLRLSLEECRKLRTELSTLRRKAQDRLGEAERKSGAIQRRLAGDRAEKASIKTRIEETVAKLDRCILDAQLRHDTSMSQAITAAVVCFVVELERAVRSKDGPALERLAKVGLVLQQESLLSSYDKELGMIEDQAAATFALDGVVFSLRRGSKSGATTRGEMARSVRMRRSPDPFSVRVFDSERVKDESDTTGRVEMSRFRVLGGIVIDHYVNAGVMSEEKSSGAPSSFDYTLPSSFNLSLEPLRQIEVQIDVPADMYDALPPCLKPKESTAAEETKRVANVERDPESSWFEAPKIRILPLLFTQGINEAQDLQNLKRDIDFQRFLNKHSLRRLTSYVEDYRKLSSHLRPENLRQAELSLDDLRVAVEAGEKDFTKHFEILILSGDIARMLGASRLTNCMSGKDRTGMSVTLEEARIVGRRHRLCRELDTSWSRETTLNVMVCGFQVENWPQSDSLKRHTGKLYLKVVLHVGGTSKTSYSDEIDSPAASSSGNVSWPLFKLDIAISLSEYERGDATIEIMFKESTPGFFQRRKHVIASRTLPLRDVLPPVAVARQVASRLAAKESLARSPAHTNHPAHDAFVKMDVESKYCISGTSPKKAVKVLLSGVVVRASEPRKSVDGLVGPREVIEIASFMRQRGVRLQNCRKNIGKAKYSLNNITLMVLPKCYMPPGKSSGSVER
eukprot:g2282.t1